MGALQEVDINVILPKETPKSYFRKLIKNAVFLIDIDALDKMHLLTCFPIQKEHIVSINNLQTNMILFPTHPTRQLTFSNGFNPRLGVTF